MADIDRLLLPKSALFDTTVLIPALGQAGPSDDRLSGPLWDAMFSAKRQILIATPSVAEISRRAPAIQIPRARNVWVASFDQPAAEILGKRFPPEVLIAVRDEITGATLHYIKYDAMIVACAVRHRAEIIVSSDAGIRKLAARIELPVMMPSDFAGAQGTLF